MIGQAQITALLLSAVHSAHTPALSPVIRHATREEILARGLGKVTAGRVATRAGVSRVTVYRHVGNVDTLVSAAIDDDLAATALAGAQATLLGHDGQRTHHDSGTADIIAALITGAATHLAADALVQTLRQHDPARLVAACTHAQGAIVSVFTPGFQAVAQAHREHGLAVGDYLTRTTSAAAMTAGLVSLMVPVLLAKDALDDALGGHDSARPDSPERSEHSERSSHPAEHESAKSPALTHLYDVVLAQVQAP